MKNILKVGNRGQKTYRYEGTDYEGAKAFWKGRKLSFFVNFPCSWIRIRIPNTDPDPREQTESKWIRIHNNSVNWLSHYLQYVF